MDSLTKVSDHIPEACVIQEKLLMVVKKRQSFPVKTWSLAGPCCNGDIKQGVVLVALVVVQQRKARDERNEGWWWRRRRWCYWSPLLPAGSVTSCLLFLYLW